MQHSHSTVLLHTQAKNVSVSRLDLLGMGSGGLLYCTVQP
jgi:hypothetical protein